MNKTYRTVWSQARNAFIATGENAKAKGKPSSNVKALSSAVVLALAGLASGPAEAAAPGRAWNTSVDINNVGVIEGTGGSAGINAGGQAITGSVINNGEIHGSRGIDLWTAANVTGNITNLLEGTIRGDDTGIRIKTTSSLNGSISNSGMISGYTGIEIDSSTVTGDIVNDETGKILGITYGIELKNGSVSGSITNALGGTISGTSGVGIKLVSGSTVSGRIINGGIISGGTSGILLENGGTISSGITNSGTISGVDNGITVKQGDSYVSDITNDKIGTVIGTISGDAGIYVFGPASVDTIHNHGLITGRLGGVVIGYGTVGNISNNGLISSTGGVGIAVKSNSTISGSIINSGLINAYKNVSSTISGVGILIDHSTINGSIVNDVTGTIAGGLVGIKVNNGGHVGDIINDGTISANLGIVAQGSGSNIDSIHNHGLISSNNASGISFGTAGPVSSINNDGTVVGFAGGITITDTPVSTISNSGTISSSFGSGIIIFGPSSIVSSITNSGTISGLRSAINVDLRSTVSHILIEGVNTAKFIGEVVAANTPVTVASGATYTMDDGQLFTLTNSSFTNDGMLRIGENSNATIAGQFNNTGTFSPTVTDAGYGRLFVDGNATLGGTLFVDVKAGGQTELLTAANTYNGTVSGIITASGLVDGTFAGDVLDNSLLFDFSAVYNPSSVDLNIADADNTSISEIVRMFRNLPAYDAAKLLDQVLEDDPGGELAQLFMKFTSGQEKDINNAVSQTLPLMTGGQVFALLNALRAAGNIIQAQNGGNPGISSGDEAAGDRRFWAKPFGAWANQDERNHAEGFDADSFGVVFGADTTVGEASRLGAAFVYGRTNVDSNSNVARQNADIDSYLLALYGSHAFSPATEMNFQIDYGWHNTEGERNLGLLLPGQQAKSDYNSWSAHLGVGLAHTYELSEKTSLTPSVRADYTLVDDDGYREKGGGVLNLKVDGNRTEELILSVDGKLAHKLSDKATFTANLGVGYDVINDESQVSSIYAGAPGASFNTYGLDPSPWMVRGGLGIVGNVTDSLEITARYDYEGRQDFDNQSASVNLRWAF